MAKKKLVVQRVEKEYTTCCNDGELTVTLSNGKTFVGGFNFIGSGGSYRDRDEDSSWCWEILSMPEDFPKEFKAGLEAAMDRDLTDHAHCCGGCD